MGLLWVGVCSGLVGTLFGLMSTKIFNGYQIHLPSGTDLFDFVEQITKPLQETYQNLYTQRAILDAVVLWDHAQRVTQGLEPDSDEVIDDSMVPVAIAEQRMWARQRRIVETGLRDPAYDFGFNVTFLAGRDQNQVLTSELYALIYTEQQNLVDVWETQTGVENYGYWDNTDKTEEVSELEWDTRREVWDQILGYNKPVTKGLSWSLVGEGPNLGFIVSLDRSSSQQKEQLTPFLPSLEQRAHEIALRTTELSKEEFETAGWVRLIINKIEELKPKLVEQLPQIGVETLFVPFEPQP